MADATDDDLIRRGDALAAVYTVIEERGKDAGIMARQLAKRQHEKAIRALPAQIAPPADVAGPDTVYTEGFPAGWSMVHRTDCTLLCCPPDHLGFTNAIAAAPRLMQGKLWLDTAQMIAAALSGEAKAQRAKREAESCDECGYGPKCGEDGEHLPNTHAMKPWVCDNCNHRNQRPLPGYDDTPADAIEALARENAALTENFDALMIKAQEAVDGQAAALFEVVALKAENAALTARAEAAEAKVANVRKAVAEYHLALDRRQHGGVAADACLTKVQVALEMPWVQGAALAEIGGGNG